MNPVDFLAKVVHVSDFRMRSRRMVDKTITITGLRGVPEQDDL